MISGMEIEMRAVRLRPGDPCWIASLDLFAATAELPHGTAMTFVRMDWGPIPHAVVRDAAGKEWVLPRWQITGAREVRVGMGWRHESDPAALDAIARQIEQAMGLPYPEHQQAEIKAYIEGLQDVLARYGRKLVKISNR